MFRPLSFGVIILQINNGADTDMSSKFLPYKLSFYWRNTAEHNVVIVIFAVDLNNSIKITISIK